MGDIEPTTSKVWGTWRIIPSQLMGWTPDFMEDLGHARPSQKQLEEFMKKTFTMKVELKEGGVCLSLVYDDPALGSHFRPPKGPIKLGEPFYSYTESEDRHHYAVWQMQDDGSLISYNHFAQNKNVYYENSSTVLEDGRLQCVLHVPKTGRRGVQVYERAQD